MGGAPADGRELVVTETMENFEFPNYYPPPGTGGGGATSPPRTFVVDEGGLRHTSSQDVVVTETLENVEFPSYNPPPPWHQRGGEPHSMGK